MLSASGGNRLRAVDMPCPIPSARISAICRILSSHLSTDSYCPQCNRMNPRCAHIGIIRSYECAILTTVVSKRCLTFTTPYLIKAVATGSRSRLGARRSRVTSRMAFATASHCMSRMAGGCSDTTTPTPFGPGEVSGTQDRADPSITGTATSGIRVSLMASRAPGSCSKTFSGMPIASSSR